MIQVREAQPDEYPVLGEILFNSFRPYFALGANLEERRRILTNIRGLSERHQIYLATYQDQIAGVIIFKINRFSLYIQGFAVDSAYRGRGVGRALLNKMVELARAAQNYLIILRTSPAMKDAIRLYTSFGFERAPEYDEQSKLAFIYML